MRRDTLRRLGFGAVALATLASLPACGGNSDEAKVRTAVVDYLDEVGEENYQAACGFLHADAKSKLGGDCAAALRQRYANLPATVRADLDEISVDDVAINGGTATVRDAEVEVETKTTTRRKGKRRTSTSHRPAPDVTAGNGFTLKKSGGDWRLAAV